MFKKCLAGLMMMIGGFVPLQGDHLPAPGRTTMSEIEEAYKKGEYNPFLTALDEQFKRAGKAGALRGVFESAKKAIKSKAVQIDKIVKENQNKIQQLDKSRNEQLISAAAESPNLEVSHKIDAIVFGGVSEEDQKLLRELDALKYTIPDTAETIDNKMTAFEVEYYIKSLLLDISSHRSKNPSPDFEKKKIALVLEKFSRMEKTATDASDTAWIEKIQQARKAFTAQKAYQFDVESLQNLALGKIPSENSVEEKVKAIMMDYQQQKSLIAEQNQTEIAQK